MEKGKMSYQEKQNWCNQNEQKDTEFFINTFSGCGKFQFELIDVLPKYSELDYQTSATTKDGVLKAVYVVEFKNRFNYNYTDFIIQKEGSFIEPDKYAFLLQEYITKNKIPLYINLWKDGKVTIWNLKKLIFDQKKTLKYDPKRNIKKSYDGEKTIEGRFLLRLEDGITLNTIS